MKTLEISCGKSRTAVKAVLQGRARLAIGARWTPAHVRRVDSEKGTYEEVNPPLDGEGEMLVQAALLMRPAPRRPFLRHVAGGLLQWVS